MLKSIHLCNWSYKCTNSNTVLNLTFVMIGGLVTVCYNAFFFSGLSLWAHLDHLCNHFLAIFSSCWGILGHFWVILAIFCHLLSNPPPHLFLPMFIQCSISSLHSCINGLINRAVTSVPALSQVAHQPFVHNFRLKIPKCNSARRSNSVCGPVLWSFLVFRGPLC